MFRLTRSVGDSLALNSKNLLPMEHPVTSASVASARHLMQATCCAFRPGGSQHRMEEPQSASLPSPRFPCLFPRTLSTRRGVPVNAARATATRTSWPPPSPVLPSSLTTREVIPSLCLGGSTCVAGGIYAVAWPCLELISLAGRKGARNDALQIPRSQAFGQ